MIEIKGRVPSCLDACVNCYPRKQVYQYGNGIVTCRDGQVDQVWIVQSTGFDALDWNVVAAIKRASPFPRPPVEAELILPITYKLL